jgi:hypothetical protein
MRYLRYEATTPNSRGAHTGIFGLANGLARGGKLTAADHDWWRTNNAWYDAAYRDPGTVDPTLFDKAVHPVTSSWFKDSATHLIERVPGYLDLLDRHGVGWVLRTSDDPGEVLYEDDVQVIVRPRS